MPCAPLRLPPCGAGLASPHSSVASAPSRGVVSLSAALGSPPAPRWGEERGKRETPPTVAQSTLPVLFFHFSRRLGGNDFAERDYLVLHSTTYRQKSIKYNRVTAGLLCCNAACISWTVCPASLIARAYVFLIECGEIWVTPASCEAFLKAL